MPYSVDHWGSHPNENNDDCFSGEDFDTLAEAEAAFAVDCADIWVAYIVLSGDDGTERVRRNPAHFTKAAKRRRRAEDSDWLREYAHQAGMVFGAQGFNDVMGW